MKNTKIMNLNLVSEQRPTVNMEATTGPPFILRVRHSAARSGSNRSQTSGGVFYLHLHLHSKDRLAQKGGNKDGIVSQQRG